MYIHICPDFGREGSGPSFGSSVSVTCTSMVAQCQRS